MKVRDEIAKFSTESDKPILNWLLDRYHWSSQWRFVAKCEFVKCGPAYFQANRIWKPTNEGRALYEYANGFACPACKQSGIVDTGIGSMPCEDCKQICTSGVKL